MVYKSKLKKKSTPPLRTIIFDSITRHSLVRMVDDLKSNDVALVCSDQNEEPLYMTTTYTKNSKKTLSSLNELEKWNTKITTVLRERFQATREEDENKEIKRVRHEFYRWRSYIENIDVDRFWEAVHADVETVDISHANAMRDVLIQSCDDVTGYERELQLLEAMVEAGRMDNHLAKKTLEQAVREEKDAYTLKEHMSHHKLSMDMDAWEWD